MPEIVTTFEGRPCITGLAYLQYLTPELRKWVRENCETVPHADVYLLPDGKMTCPKCSTRVRPDYDLICLDESCPMGGANA